MHYACPVELNFDSAYQKAKHFLRKARKRHSERLPQNPANKRIAKVKAKIKKEMIDDRK